MYLVIAPMEAVPADVPLPYWAVDEPACWMRLPHIHAEAVAPDDGRLIVRVRPGTHPVAATIKLWVREQELGFTPLVTLLERWRLVVRDAVLLAAYGPDARTREMIEALDRTGHTWARRAVDDALRAWPARTPELMADEWAGQVFSHHYSVYRFERRRALVTILAGRAPFTAYAPLTLCMTVQVGAPVPFGKIVARVADPLALDGIWTMPLAQKLAVLWRSVAPELWAALELDRCGYGWPDTLAPNIMMERLVRADTRASADLAAIVAGDVRYLAESGLLERYEQLRQVYTNLVTAAFAAWDG